MAAGKEILKLNHSMTNADKERVKVEMVSIDELEQLREAVKNIDQERAAKNLEVEKIEGKIQFLESELEEAKTALMAKIQEVNSMKMELKLSQDIL